MVADCPLFIMENPVVMEIAHTAARLVVEEGVDWGSAKRRALKALGLPIRTALPDNTLLEAAVREHIALFHADTQPQELHALRSLALLWMERLQVFRPHLGGAVWWGTATRLSDIELSLFCDDSKSAEITLINLHVPYTPHTMAGWRGTPVDALSLHSYSEALAEEIGIHLRIYDFHDLRGAVRADALGRVPRGNIAAVRRLLQEQDGCQ